MKINNSEVKNFLKNKIIANQLLYLKSIDYIKATRDKKKKMDYVFLDLCSSKILIKYYSFHIDIGTKNENYYLQRYKDEVKKVKDKFNTIFNDKDIYDNLAYVKLLEDLCSVTDEYYKYFEF